MLFALLSASAWASPGYPTEIETALAMPCAPACTVCHETLGGGGGTVTRAFGIAMEAEGLTGGSNSASLVTALDALTLNLVDSDGDGTIDTDELTAGFDPNPDGVDMCGGGETLTPRYGCGASTRPGAPLGVIAVAVALGFATTRRRP